MSEKFDLTELPPLPLTFFHPVTLECPRSTSPTWKTIEGTGSTEERLTWQYRKFPIRETWTAELSTWAVAAD